MSPVFETRSRVQWNQILLKSLTLVLSPLVAFLLWNIPRVVLYSVRYPQTQESKYPERIILNTSFPRIGLSKSGMQISTDRGKKICFPLWIFNVCHVTLSMPYKGVRQCQNLFVWRTRIVSLQNMELSGSVPCVGDSCPQEKPQPIVGARTMRTLKKRWGKNYQPASLDQEACSLSAIALRRRRAIWRGKVGHKKKRKTWVKNRTNNPRPHLSRYEKYPDRLRWYLKEVCSLKPGYIMRRFAYHLRMLRQDRCYTQKKLSEALGIPQATISEWENGLVWIKPEILEKLAAFFEVEVKEFFGR